MLSREPTVAYRLKDELARVAGGTDIAAFKHSGRRPDGLARNDLGNARATGGPGILPVVFLE